MAEPSRRLPGVVPSPSLGAPSPWASLGDSYPSGRAMIRVPQPVTAVAFMAWVAVLFVPGVQGLVRFLGPAGLVAAEWLLLFAPALLLVVFGFYDPTATFSLRRPSRRSLAGAVLLAGGATPLLWGMVWLQGLVLPVPPALAEAMERLITAQTPRQLAWTLFGVALTPALCEEAVFRGVLLSSTRSLPAWRAVLLNGVVFGAFHLSFETPVRFLPAACLGIVIAWAVLVSRSIWIGVLMHFLNNASIVLLASAPSLRGLLTDPDAPPPVWLVAVAAVSAGVGVRVLGGAPPEAAPAGARPSGDTP